MPRAVGRLGASACKIMSHLVRHNFGQTCRMTLKLVTLAYDRLCNGGLVIREKTVIGPNPGLLFPTGAA